MEAKLVGLQEERLQAMKIMKNKDVDVKKNKLKIGDFVMVRNDKDKKAKLEKRWRGPARVTKLEDGANRVTVEYLVKGKGHPTQTVHVSNIKFYDWAVADIPEELVALAEHTMEPRFVWKRILDVQKKGKHFDVVVEWSDGTISPHSLIAFAQDSPDGLRYFLRNKVPDESKHLLKEILGLKPIKRLMA